MSTAKSTLFRFATVRAPELISDSAKQEHFVQHPDPVSEGSFTDLVTSPGTTPVEQIDMWRDIASGFSPYTSIEEVKTEAGASFFEFANWLAKNKKAVAADPAFMDGYPAYSALPQLSAGIVISLWDNLFFQLIQNESAGIRDQIMQLLIANHFRGVQDVGGEGWHKAALAKVMLPKELFVSAAVAPAGGSSTVYKKPLQQALDIALAKDKAEALNTLTDDLKKLQLVYERETVTNYNDARTTHDNNVSDIITGNTVIVDELTGESRLTPGTTLPVFDFTPEPEMSSARVAQLTGRSLFLANQLNLSNLNTFAEAFDVLKKESARQTTAAFQSNRLRRTLINLNNIILPVDDDIVLPGQLYGYMVRVEAIGTDLYKIFLTVNAGQPGGDVVDSSYTAQWSGSTNTNTVFTDQASGNHVVMQLFPAGLTIPSGISSFTLNGTLTLSNGVTLSFNSTVSKTLGATGTMQPANVINHEENTAGIDLNIPTGFGLKRIGIADYRLVEQSTCCHVPGEVSHIENVMAREYKEKSNRRLRRSEETITSERQTEKEHLTDTTSTDRFEMQQQVSEVINKDISTGINTNAHYGSKIASLDIGSNFASNTSQQHSNSQAVNYAKDITIRALERVVNRVREERVMKVIEEYEEQNKHGFDNRTGENHVSGVYRWVDKIYKNQVFNYGKRLMYEFMIPQPAVFHKAAMKTLPDSGAATVLTKPVDPRTADLPDFRSIDESNFAIWAAAYNAEVQVPPQESMFIGKSLTFEATVNVVHIEFNAKEAQVAVPEGYYATDAKVQIAAMDNYDARLAKCVCVKVGDTDFADYSSQGKVNFKSGFMPISRFTGNVPVSVSQSNYFTGNINVSVRVQRSPELYRQWQLDTFRSIIEAYEKKMAEYNETATVKTEVSTNPLFYRQIENTVLRKNCISYLVGQHNLGKKFYSGSTATDLRPDLNEDMDKYAGLVKFIEQAFEWELISYNFYPFYWGEKNKWQELYQQDVNDPLFRSFLQSGMARVIATVRPGFEEAVMHYMATGQVWNGGDVPVVGDDLYLSIVEELKNPTYYVEETWETRVPTTLTLIQAGSIALDVAGLPCDCGDTETGIEPSTAQMGVVIPA